MRDKVVVPRHRDRGMLTASDFWKGLDQQRAPGVLVLCVLLSWKPVGDRFGHHAVDLLSGMLDAIGRAAFDDAQMHARLTTTVIGAYWAETEADVYAGPWFERWLPITIKTRQGELPVDVQSLSIARTQSDSGRDLYMRARDELDQVVARLPETERYPTLSRSWDEAVSE